MQHRPDLAIRSVDGLPAHPYASCHAHVTPRERTVLRRLVKGQQACEIAPALRISIHTVRAHVRNLHIKTETRSLQALVVWAIRHAVCCVAVKPPGSA